MEIETTINARTRHASVVVLEDHDETVDCICRELRRDGKLVSVANTLDKFEDLVKSKSTFDVYSIDWKINQRNVGVQALDLVTRYKRDAGKVVYSVHNIETNAYSAGADLVLRKKLANYDEYLDEIEKGAKLGLLRQIARTLKELGHPVDLSSKPSLGEEHALFRKATIIAREQVMAGDTTQLASLLRRRGWWGNFDVRAYSNLQAELKLTTLLGCVEATVDDLSQILECDVAVAHDILNNNNVPPQYEDNADELLSILAYLLRLSKDEPLLMPAYWRARDLFAHSLSGPPWDAVGLYEYLKASGISGIDQALNWIRRN